MLGLTTYEESLRTIGHLLDHRGSTVSGAADGTRSASTSPTWTIQEDATAGRVRVQVGGDVYDLPSDQLAADLLMSRARRGTGGSPGWISDVLRTIGGGLDALEATSVYLEGRPEMVGVRCTLADDPSVPVEIAYADEDLAALREAAAAHRNGTPLWRILLLHGEHLSTSALRAPLVAECSVEVRPYLYGKALELARELPDLVIAHVALSSQAEACAATLHVLRTSAHSASVPILLVHDCPREGGSLRECAALADLAVQGPLTPAVLRSHARSLLLGRDPRWSDALGAAVAQ